MLSLIGPGQNIQHLTSSPYLSKVHHGHIYSLSHSDLLTEELVDKILQYEKDENQKQLLAEQHPFFKSLLVKDESHWESQKKIYLAAEKWIRTHKIPSWEVAGPLNYGMSLDQMKETITQKFKEMIASGNLMTEQSFYKKHTRESFCLTSDEKANNLTRIWGAEFLRSNLLDDPTLNVTEHILIIDDNAQEIEVQVDHLVYPHLSSVNNGYIVSRKIEGIESAEEYRSSNKLSELLFWDFADSGNIIRDADNIGWIVDTEAHSFNYPTLDHTSNLAREYLKKRFIFLAGDAYFPSQTFKISFNDLA